MVYEGFTSYMINKLLDHSMGKASYTMPTVYVALYSGDPLVAGTEKVIGTGSYARKTVTWASATFSSPTGTIANSADVDFTTATTAWGTVDYVAIFDASTAGNMLASGPLEVSRSVQINDPVKFPTGELKIRLTQATV